MRMSRYRPVCIWRQLARRNGVGEGLNTSWIIKLESLVTYKMDPENMNSVLQRTLSQPPTFPKRQVCQEGLPRGQSALVCAARWFVFLVRRLFHPPARLSSRKKKVQLIVD